MLMLNISILIVLLLAYLYVRTFKYSDNMPHDIDKKIHRLHFLYPMAGFILTKTGLEKKFLSNSEISRKIRALYVSDYQEVKARLYWYQKTSLIIFIIFVFSSLSLITSIQSLHSKVHSFEANLIRPEEGEGDSKITLKFRMENETDKEDFYEDEITIDNRERIYTEKEWNELLDKAILYLEEEVLGENENSDNVYTKLNFIKNIPGTGIAVEWRPRDYQLVSNNGEIMNQDMETYMETLVTATLRYRDKRVEHTMPLTIWPVELDYRKKLYKELQNALDNTEKETESIKEWSLPRRIGDYLLTWEIPNDNPAIFVLILGFFGAILIWFYRDRELDSRMNLRKNQMLLDYPEIINKFSLLVGAGMTIKQAWNKISLDYKNKIEADSKYKRYAYDEMLLTSHELKLGIPEVNAYEQFGIRTGLLPYKKFSSMLVQNLKKGNRNMINLLKHEAMEAFQERKETAKKLGEEASTKLLGPMLIMLIIVLIIIMIPAFISIQI